MGTAAVHILTPLGFALILGYFYRGHQRSYLRSWALFWFWLALFELSGWIVSAAMRDVPFVRIDRLLFATFALIAVALAIVALIAGIFDVIFLRTIRRRAMRALRVAAITAALFSVIYLYATSTGRSQTLMQFQVIVGTSLGVTYLGSAFAIWGLGKRESRSWILLAISLGAMGAAELTGAVARATWTTQLRAPSTLLDIVLLGLIAVAMVIRLLDDERLAALSAASQVAHMVYHEELTGLANRSLFIDHLIMSVTQAERRNRRIAVLFLDIDGFKPVNDTLGHDVGDELLKEIAQRIRSVVRSEDTVARFGGDEFVILIPDLKAPEDTGRIGRKLTDVVRAPFEANGHEIRVSTSIGIAVFPEDGKDADTLMKNADTAMYQAKERGGDRFQLYSISMNHRALEKLELEMGLRRGLEFRQFEVCYQPFVDESTTRLIGFEALLRWDHPVRGLLSPEEFMPAAERCGMLAPIGRFVLTETCRHMAAWQKDLPRTFVVALNLSSDELMEDEIVGRLTESLREFQIDPQRFELEITEASAFTDFGMTAPILSRLREQGFRITIDDFGSAFTSLTQLKSVPASALKLSRVLTADISDPRNAVITSSVIMLAQGLGLEVACEGVETREQLEILRHQRCDRFQGKLISEPLTSSEVVDYVRTCESRYADA